MVNISYSNIDRLLVSVEKLFESRQPRAFNDELLTDKEVVHILKVSRRKLQDYRINGILSYIQVGGKILSRTSDVQWTIMSGFNEAYRLRGSSGIKCLYVIEGIKNKQTPSKDVCLCLLFAIVITS